MQVQQGGLTIAAYTYDGDGKLVKAVEDGKVTHYAGAHYEACLSGCPESTGVVERSYYYAGSARIAMRVQYETVNEVYYILTDHLGSTSLTYRTSDGLTTPQYYKPWGELRPGPDSSLPTDYQFTGQRNPGWGLYFYRARWYDSSLGRFSQADSMIPNPGDPIMWDRFAYTRNNPLLSTHCTSLGTTCWVGGKDEPFELLSDANAIGEQFFR